MEHQAGEIFKGKVAIVTGAAQGLGRAYAQALLDRGARVVASDRARIGLVREPMRT